MNKSGLLIEMLFWTIALACDIVCMNDLCLKLCGIKFYVCMTISVGIMLIICFFLIADGSKLFRLLTDKTPRKKSKKNGRQQAKNTEQNGHERL